jgi:hypothetical protein
MATDSAKDFYINEEGLLVFTREYHLKRGVCCGSGCLNCPFDHINVSNKTILARKGPIR